jgi:hypothetical protein
MLHSAIILIHVSGATIAMIAGFLAMIFRKGSSLHRIAGNFFFAAMICMAGAGSFSAAFLKPNGGNLMGGTLTLYLVATGWMAGRRRERKTSAFDSLALLGALAVAVGGATMGMQAAASPTHTKFGYGPPLYFTFGIIALILAAFDVRMIVRGGVTGAQRIGRHLWRMCFAFLVALISFYPGQARLFSPEVRKTNLLYIPLILVLGSTLAWLSRMSRQRDLRSVGL